jgi:DNA-binding protein HU-beta
MAAKRLTKSQVIAELAEVTELDKKSVNRVFEGLGEVIKKQLGARGPGEFVIPGLLKLKAVKKPATKDRPGKNPFTGEAMIIKGKPASKKIRATALKSLKDMIQLSRDEPRLEGRVARGFPLAMHHSNRFVTCRRGPIPLPPVSGEARRSRGNRVVREASSIGEDEAFFVLSRTNSRRTKRLPAYGERS